MTFVTGLIAIVLHFSSAAQQGNDKSLLWQISGNNLKKPSYLFGTIHMICPNDYIWTSKMKASLDKSDKVCLEMDLDDPNVMKEISAAMIDHSGKKLKDYFTAEQYQAIRKFIKDGMGIDIEMAQTLKPFALETFVAAKSTACDSPMSYEEIIMTTAKKDNKEVIGLEDVREQISALESIPTDSLIKELIDCIANSKNDDSEYRKLVIAYKDQDLSKLFALITQSKEMYGADMNVFLDERNKRWISRIEDDMKSSSVFFAVGAGHLAGPSGVINLLRARGYKVEALR